MTTGGCDITTLSDLLTIIAIPPLNLSGALRVGNVPSPLGGLFVQIDSALDTHKVRRVAAMLADRSRNGKEQCIVISHRPEMQERGR